MLRRETPVFFPGLAADTWRLLTARCIPRTLILKQSDDSTLNVRIHRLRRKLKVHGDPIRTI